MWNSFENISKCYENELFVMIDFNYFENIIGTIENVFFKYCC